MGRLAALLAICVYAGKEVRLHVMRALKEGKKSSVSTNTIPVALQEAWVKMWLVHLSNAYLLDFTLGAPPPSLLLRFPLITPPFEFSL